MSITIDSNDRPAFSSVELTRNAKGGYQWVIKCYVEAGCEQVALLRTKMLDEQLRAEYDAPEVKDEKHDTDN